MIQISVFCILFKLLVPCIGIKFFKPRTKFTEIGFWKKSNGFFYFLYSCHGLKITSCTLLSKVHYVFMLTNSVLSIVRQVYGGSGVDTSGFCRMRDKMC